MKHTKGKWEVKKTLGYSVKVGDKYIAGIHGQEKKVKDDSKALGYRYDNSETVANANLIASAPEMKKALYDIIDFASDTMPSSCSVLRHDSPSYDPAAAKQYDLMKKIVDIANRAIIKAKGSE